MELQSLYPDKTILKVFAELFSKSDPFPFYWSFAIGYIVIFAVSVYHILPDFARGSCRVFSADMFLRLFSAFSPESLAKYTKILYTTHNRFHHCIRYGRSL